MTITKVYRVDPLNPDETTIKSCCKEVREGRIIVFPTETVYGLGAYVFDVNAVRKVFLAKGRPPDNPLIVHIASLKQLEEVAEDIPEDLIRVSKVVWPGPITFILKRGASVPREVSGGLNTVAVRMPGHPVALKLIECVGPIAAPSANISGRPSPTEPHHVYVDMFGRVDIILDAGETFFGVESTIVDMASDPPKILRPGPFPYEKISDIIGKQVEIPEFARGLREGNIALAPGVKYRHYAPKTRLLVVEADDYDKLDFYSAKVLEVVREKCDSIRCAVIASKETLDVYRDIDVKIIVIGSRGNLYEVARNLFKVLREVDRLGVDLGIVEGFPESGIGLAIMNRLRKASGFNVVKVDLN